MHHLRRFLLSATMEESDLHPIKSVSDNLESATTPPPKKEKKKSKKTTAIQPESAPEPSTSAPEEDFIPLPKPEKTKKSKKRKVDEADEALPADTPKKKKQKKDKSLPDPSADSSLTPQGRKALSYAHTRFRHPSKWKFRKAPQNWLIRNYWCPTAVRSSRHKTIHY